MLIELTSESYKKMCVDADVIRALFHRTRNLAPGPIAAMELTGRGGELMPEDAVSQLQAALDARARIWHGNAGIQDPERLILEWRPKLDSFFGESGSFKFDTWSNFNTHSHRPPADFEDGVKDESKREKLIWDQAEGLSASIGSYWARQDDDIAF